MEFIEIALRMENEIIRAYRELAEKCVTHEGIRRILLMLASNQEQHALSLSRMKENLQFGVEASPAYEEARRLFSGMRKDEETFSCGMDQLQLYQEARELLQKKYDYYQEIGTHSAPRSAEKVLQDLLSEEKRQIKVLDNIIEMVSRPQYWLDNAEFFHLEEY
jgi:rubrerythrin